ncbi:hypothetical protein BOTCAL_0066g00210 [Botryotinia calthae]|uniref:Uncharacterized protein n=1 Tax=Botryotinia calthae TaxID=38488 RepID=A0A4Y8D9B5_9HELO|nr:hypothetical protein BOTCAL_0066g00210 [Botryotinia calthae]
MHNPMCRRLIKNMKVAKKGKTIMRPEPRMERVARRATFRSPDPEDDLASGGEKSVMEENSFVINKHLSSSSEEKTQTTSEKVAEHKISPKLPANSCLNDSESGIFEELLEKFPRFFHPDEDLPITNPISPISEDTIQHDSTPEPERNRAKSALLTFFSSPFKARDKLRITKKEGGLGILKNCWSLDKSSIQLHIDTIDDIMEIFFSATNQYDTLMLWRGAKQSYGIKIELQGLRKSDTATDSGGVGMSGQYLKE